MSFNTARYLHSGNIAGTGTITIDGKIGPIGGINENRAAAKAGVQLF